MADPQTNKANAIAFCQMMFSDCRPHEVIETFVGAKYIQHNPHAGSARTQRQPERFVLKEIR